MFVISTKNHRIQPLFLGNWTPERDSTGGPILYSHVKIPESPFQVFFLTAASRGWHAECQERKDRACCAAGGGLCPVR
jgi:hypothetical protein